MLEKNIEAHLVKRVAEAGGHAYKFVSPQRVSVPDRLVLGTKEQAGEELKRLLALFGVEVQLFDAATLDGYAAGIAARMVHFVELKALGRKPTQGQLREHKRLRDLGFEVLVIDNKEDIDARYRK